MKPSTCSMLAWEGASRHLRSTASMTSRGDSILTFIAKLKRLWYTVQLSSESAS